MDTHAITTHPSFEALEPRLLLSGIAQEQAMELFELSPALFIENQGQWADESIRYVHNGSGANVLFTDDGPVFQVFQREPIEDAAGGDGLGDPDVLRPELPDEQGDYITHATQFSVSFDGANAAGPVGLEQAGGLFNYYVGEQADWRTNVPAYETVAYMGLYDGIDLHTWGRRDSLKYEFHVAPGADYRAILVSYEGIQGLSIDQSGALHVQTELGELIDDAPYIYQQIDGERVEIAGRFELIDGETYSFNVTGEFDAGAELIIDPDLAWSTFLGGNASDKGWGIAADASGGVYVTGLTSSADFPTPGGYDTTKNGSYDAFVAKFSSASSLLWSTFLGGNNNDYGRGIAADASGGVYVTGYTRSADFPTPAGYDTSHNGGDDAFVAKFSSAGSLLWSTFLGGNDYDYGQDIAADGSGGVYVTGRTNSADFPTPAGYDTTHNGNYDAFVAKFNSAGSLAWSTFLGGNGYDYGQGIAADGSGGVYVTGYTASADFPTPGGFDTSHNGGDDAFVAKFSSAGSLLWSTFLGGNASDWGEGIATDASGGVYVTGSTSSADFPTPAGYDTSHNGGDDAFVAKFSSAGSLLWSTFLGGEMNEQGYAIATDASDSVYVTGYTDSADFPTRGAYDTSYNGGDYDAFVAKFSSAGSLLRSTFLGGSSNDEGHGIAADTSGGVYVTGETWSADFPTPVGYETSFNGGIYDAFVAKFAFDGSGFLFLSDQATNPTLGNPEIALLIGETATLYLWAGMPEYMVINGLGIDILADTTGVVLASDHTVQNPNLVIADRWNTPINHGTPGQLVTDIKAVAVTAVGLSGDPALQPYDATYDPVSGYYLVSTIEYEAAATGTTEVFIQTNDLIISFAEGMGALYFGDGDAAVNPYLEGIRSTLADATITVTLPPIRLFFSDQATNPTFGNPDVTLTRGETATLYLWADLDENVTINGLGIDIDADSPGIVLASDHTVQNPNLVIADRWNTPINHGTPGQLVTGINALAIDAVGLSGDPALQEYDTTYDPLSGYYLVGTIEYEATAVGSTEVFIETNNWTVSFAEGREGGLFFGDSDAAVNGSVSGVRSTLADATITVTMPRSRLFLSDQATNPTLGNSQINLTRGETATLYLWADMSQYMAINGLGIDILAETPGVVLTSDHTVQNPNLIVGSRWDTIDHGTPGELVSGINALATDAPGLSGNPVLQPYDATYDLASGFYLVSTIEYQATAVGSTDVFIETNNWTISFAEGKDGDLYFGDGDAAVNGSVSGVRSTLTDATITVTMPRSRLFLSDQATNPTLGNPQINLTMGDTATLYLWADMSQYMAINGLGIDILADTTGVVLASDHTVQNPDLIVGGRWDSIDHGTPGQLVSGINALATDAPGLSGDPVLQPYDATYDPASGFYLVSTIEYQATAAGATEVFIETNDLTISFAAGKDGDLYFGDGDAAVDGTVGGVRSALAEAMITVVLPPGDMNGDGLVNAQDINPFVLALTYPAEYATQYPNINLLAVGDLGGPEGVPDGLFNNQDINPFVYLLTHQPPEGAGDIPVTESADPVVGPQGASRPIAAAKAPRGKSHGEGLGRIRRWFCFPLRERRDRPGCGPRPAGDG